MIDTHSHIYSEEFDEDREEVIARAKVAGVSMILLPAIDSESHERQETLASSHPDLFRQMMGLHPTSVKENYAAELEIVKERLFLKRETEEGDAHEDVGVPAETEEGDAHEDVGVPAETEEGDAHEDVGVPAKTEEGDAHEDVGVPARMGKYIAVGEIGLDFYWDTTFREEQIYVLRTQIEWAEKLGLPVVLHLRNGKDEMPETNAYKELFSLCPRGRGRTRKGIMHCFSGSLEDALKAVEMGFLLGIGGVVTYKKSTLPEIIKHVGLGNIVLETDAPYLAPVPFRGKRNESAYVRYVAEKVAEILEVSFEEVDAVTTMNAKRLFGIL